MKKKSSAISIYALLAGLFLYSCAQQDAAPGQEKSTVSRQVTDSLDYCDSSLYETVYKSGGYVLLKTRDTSDNKFASTMSMLAGGEISPATASEWAKYYDGRFNSTNLQKTNFVDFDFKTVFGILDLLERSQSGWDPDRGGFRIYFGAYPDTYSNVGLRNHINTMLVGTYDHTDVEKYYNLGHLCPPNCYGSGTSTIDYTRSPILR